MIRMGLLFDKLEDIFRNIETTQGVKKGRVLLDVGIEPAQYRSYINAGRLPSDEMLERLGRSEYVGIPAKTLKAMKAIDEYGPDIIKHAAEITLNEMDGL